MVGSIHAPPVLKHRRVKKHKILWIQSGGRYVAALDL